MCGKKLKYDEKCDEKYKEETEILDVIKTICCVSDAMSEENIQKGIAKATRYNLDVKNLEKAIEKLQDRLLDE